MSKENFIELIYCKNINNKWWKDNLSKIIYKLFQTRRQWYIHLAIYMPCGRYTIFFTLFIFEHARLLPTCVGTPNDVHNIFSVIGAININYLFHWVRCKNILHNLLVFSVLIQFNICIFVPKTIFYTFLLCIHKHNMKIDKVIALIINRKDG